MDAIEVPRYSAHLLQQLNALWLEGLLCDVTIACKNTSLSVHKLVLQAASPYLEKCVKQSDSGKSHVDLSHFDENLLQIVLEFIYSGKLKVSKETARGVMEICDELHLKSAVDAINFYIDYGNKRFKEVDTQTEAVENKNTTESIVEEPVKKKRKVASKQSGNSVDSSAKRKTETLRPKRTRKPVKPNQRKTVPRKNVKEKITDVIEKRDSDVKVASMKSEHNLASVHKDDPAISSEKDMIVKMEKEDSDFENSQKEGEDSGIINYDEDDSDTDDYDSNVLDDVQDIDDTDNNIKRIDENGKVVKKRVRKRKEASSDGKPKKKRKRKPFPCSICSKTLTSKKRQIFHEYSKHGTPIDFKSITFTVSPCAVQASITTWFLFYLGI